MHNTKAIAQIAETLIFPYFGTLWACLRMPGHAHLKYDWQYAPLMGLYLHA